LHESGHSTKLRFKAIPPLQQNDNGTFSTFVNVTEESE
jgi:hypothetical protein